MSVRKADYSEGAYGLKLEQRVRVKDSYHTKLRGRTGAVVRLYARGTSQPIAVLMDRKCRNGTANVQNFYPENIEMIDTEGQPEKIEQPMQNSPMELFEELVAPALAQLKTANLALWGWAQEECERLYRAGRHKPSIRRMEATVCEGRRLNVSTGGGFQTVGLGVAPCVEIKLAVIKGQDFLTPEEVEKVEAWLKDRYKGARIDVMGVTDVYFKIEWNDCHKELRI